MTTIVYDHENKEIAVDSRCCTGEGKILSDTIEKFITIEGVTFFYTASGDDGVELAKLISGEDCESEALKATVMFIKGGAAYMGTYSNCIIDTWILEYSDAIGSGADFALAALDFGKNANDAIEYAKTRDNFTGGEVKVFQVG